MSYSFMLASSLLLPLFTLVNTAIAPGGGKPEKSIYDFTMKDIKGKDVHLSQYRGKVVLIVNVASQCGYTGQYKDLEKLYRQYKDRGLMILGFPANNFGAQEPGSNEEIMEFCETNYGVSFDMFSKISVKGDDRHPLYTFITSRESNPDFSGDVRWNFQKYLVDRNGKIVGKFFSKVEPLSSELTGAIEAELAKK